MSFSSKTKEDTFVACGRCCALCHKFCGIKMEVHHIQEESEGGDDTFENAIPLCFDCHADMRSYDHQHPKGNKYSRNELKRHRDAWYAKIAGNPGVASNEITLDTDRRVYEVLIKIVPSQGSISFLRVNNFAGFSFDLGRLDNLRDFENYCENKPAFEFVDPDLEALRARLAKLSDSFLTTIALETFPTSKANRNTVPEEWEIDQPERFRKVVNKLHDEAKQITETYDSLVRTARRKLGVLPDDLNN